MKKIKQFLTNPRGSVTVEFIFIFFLFSVLLIFLIDVTILQATTGKVQRTSYSLLNIVKERSAVHNGKEDLTQDEVNKLKALAISLMGEDKSSNDVAVTIELHKFEEIKPQGTVSTISATRPTKKVSVTKILSDNANVCQAAGKADVTHAAPLTQNFRNSVRYASVYSVTVCRKMTNLFKGLSLSKEDQVSGWIRATAIGVSR
ncbi:tight adherence pilus pseudopilin TadF [Actinobacillus equuli]|uniref:Tight adherence protein F n=1 Tax=Actinobacillus equuli TaxID=718 RepID=A0AAX3FJY6_ACTEU|nr:tight adherence pilus pseudopilin TadF [Actinobacillus equuli]AIZ79028.1 tight adherence protein F [Actinobacillus equuli subsp. equuli]WGE45274.1 tight adherence protein F [Actinobacillus equuli subsp. equuli]VEE89122.1 tight adherence protein F [Actinobacillus equuli]